MAIKPAPLPAHFGHYDNLAPKYKDFVDEYLLDLNAAGAARRCGLPGTASVIAYKLLNRPDVRAAVAERREYAAKDRAVNGGMFVLNKLWSVAVADPRELVEIRHVPCRFCWGESAQYQFTKTEMDRVLKAYQHGVAKQPFNSLWPTGPAERAYYIAGAHGLPFDQQGGDGYTTGRDPNAECSECAGSGITVHILCDTRKLGPEARQLYRGIRINKDKIEVLMANQDLARDQLAKHYGVAVEKQDIFLRTIDPAKLSDDDLLRAVEELRAIDLERSDYATVDVKQLPQPEVKTQVPPETARERRRAAMAKAREVQREQKAQKGFRIQRPRS